MARADSLCARALAAARRGRFAEAEAALRDALRLRPEDPVGRANLATVLRRQRRPADAEVIQREALAEAPAAATHADLGGALFEQARYAEAEAAYRDALGLEPGDARARAGLAMALSSVSVVSNSLLLRRFRPGRRNWISLFAPVVMTTVFTVAFILLARVSVMATG